MPSLFSCFFGQGARLKKAENLETEVQQPAQPRVSEQAQSSTGRLERRGSNSPVPRSEDDMAQMPRGSEPNKVGEDAPAEAQSEVVCSPGLATGLLQGMTFSTRVLGFGAYGLVIKGTWDGVDVAIKLMVTARHADRTVVRELTLGPSPALTHPHICKTYDTRCIVLTDAIFDELETYREAKLQKLRRQREMLQQKQQQQPHFVKPIAEGGLSPEGSGSAAAKARPPSTATAAPAAGTASSRRRGRGRPIRFMSAAGTPCVQGPLQNPLLPLESGSAPSALHEALARLGASVGQTLTLVVMEYCCKGTLSRAIHRGIFAPCALWSARVATRALVRTAAEMARALLHLHNSGVVHGDVKPANVLLKSSRDDRRGFVAKICDFGLSHVLPEGAKSLDSDTWGTPLYMAPEAMLGHPSKASDVWSFGVMLSEALTQTPPYGGRIDQASIVFGILDGSLQLAWPEIPPPAMGTPEANLADGWPAAAAAAAAGPEAGAAALLSRRFGLVFPTTSSKSLGIAAAHGGDGAGQGQLGSTVVSSSLDCGCGGLLRTTTATTITRATTGLMLNTAGTDLPSEPTNDGGKDATFGGFGGGIGTPQASAGGAATGAVTEEEEVNMVRAFLVSLGRCCTSRAPDARPCISEVLGKLVDMEIILKTPRRRGMGSGGGGSGGSKEMWLDAGLRARQRMAAAAAGDGTCAGAVVAAACSASVLAATVAEATQPSALTTSPPSRSKDPKTREALRSFTTQQPPLVAAHQEARRGPTAPAQPPPPPPPAMLLPMPPLAPTQSSSPGGHDAQTRSAVGGPDGLVAALAGAASAGARTDARAESVPAAVAPQLEQPAPVPEQPEPQPRQHHSPVVVEDAAVRLSAGAPGLPAAAVEAGLGAMAVITVEAAGNPGVRDPASSRLPWSGSAPGTPEMSECCCCIASEDRLK